MNKNPFLIIIAAILLLTTVAPLLTSGSKPVLAATSAESLSAVNEVVVKLRRGSTSEVSGGRDTQFGRIARLVTDIRPQGVPFAVDPLIRGSLPPRAEKVVEREGLDRTFVVKVESPSNVEPTISALMASGQVEYAEPNYKIKPGASISNSRPAQAGQRPDDPKFPNQWALNNPGFNVQGYPSTHGADIKAIDAWQITTGSPDVIIAITDTGIDINHPDLAANIYTNPGEIAGNGIDDDNNGYIDDVHGYNFADNNGDVSDVLGHGTEMAGIIGAVLNNGIGISGVCQCKLLPVKFFRRTGPNPQDVDGTVADAVRAIIYSIAMGASVINASWSTSLQPGSVSPSEPQALKDAVNAANDADVLLVCIAGNDGVNDDKTAVYPGRYELPNEIVVAASDYNDLLWHVLGIPSAIRSNYGIKRVQLAAPGDLVLTTEARGDCLECSQSENPDDWYVSIEGTSAAAAYVSGVAALVKSLYPEANAPVLRRRILESVDVIPALQPYVSTGGRLDALGALTVQLQVTPPVLRKVKYKVNKQKLVVIGDEFQRGAHVIVDGTVYAATATPDTISPLSVSLPPSVFPAGVPVTVFVRNPDGGASQPLTITK